MPDQVVNCDLVPRILDQGHEGACTGYALAAVINFLLSRRNIDRAVSSRMLYELARRYDEWPKRPAYCPLNSWIARRVNSDNTIRPLIRARSSSN